ncbi:MAG: MFS transporter [Lachnospiraceae bacterium]
MKYWKTTLKELKNFLILWSTQTLSSLGSSMTNFALVIWSYQQSGSAMSTALLSVCSYAPYVLMSIFAGALSDRWNKKITMMVSDSFAALCTVIVLVLLQTGELQLWHLYCLNAVNGLMNTIQQPASDVAISLVAPKKHYQKVSGMRSFSYSLINFLTPAAAAALLAFAGIKGVILFDLITFSVAFLSLAFLIKIPKVEKSDQVQETVLKAAGQGLRYLKGNRGILYLILFLAAINLIASMYEAALPALMLSRENGGEQAMGIVRTVAGLAMIGGSIAVSLYPAPQSRVRVICNTLLLSMSTENFLLAFGTTMPVWCTGAVLGWGVIPIMNANMDVLLRSYIPIEMQGRVFAARNTFQFFTIPIGYFLGGFLIDYVLDPFMKAQMPESLWVALFGTDAGSGAAILLMILGVIGILTCLIFRQNREIWKLEQ